jgi:uncharacterized protein YndB with AHSA1/START domain
MTKESREAAPRLVVRRLIRATREEVFAAWTDPQSVSQWMCPGGIKTAEAWMDVRVGGKFRILMKDGEREYDHTGEYQRIEPPSKLVFTWILKGTDNQPTLVTVELQDLDPYCQLTLTHEKFATPGAVEHHEKGWTDIVNKLAASFGKGVEKRPEGGTDFSMKLKFAVPARKLYQQFSMADGIRHWWTLDCEMEEQVGGKAAFRFPKAGFYAVVKVARLEPGRCVEWACIDSKHPEKSGFDNLHDWVGTSLRFEFETVDEDHTQLKFTHAGLAPLECFEVCSNSWSFYLNDSLRAYLEGGVGKPYHDDSAT